MGLSASRHEEESPCVAVRLSRVDSPNTAYYTWAHTQQAEGGEARGGGGGQRGAVTGRPQPFTAPPPRSTHPPPHTNSFG